MGKKSIIVLIVGLLIGAGGTYAFTGNNKPAEHTNTQPSSTLNHNDQTTAKLQNLSGDDFDSAFIDEMILHHQGAIDMAKLIEANAKHDELKQLGRDIISAQSREIDMMRTWQIDWGYKQAPSHNVHD